MMTHLIKISFRLIMILILGPIVVKTICMIFIPRPIRKLIRNTCRFAIKVVKCLTLTSIPILLCIWKGFIKVSKKSLSMYKGSKDKPVTKIEYYKPSVDNVVDINSKRKAK